MQSLKAASTKTSKTKRFCRFSFFEKLTDFNFKILFQALELQTEKEFQMQAKF